MDITTFKTRSQRNAIGCDVDRYGVANHAWDITTHGFTVVPPSSLGVTDDWIEGLRSGVIRSCEQSGGGHRYPTSIHTPRLAKGYDLVREDDVFEQATRNPVGLALIGALLGENAFMANNRPIAEGPFDPAGADSGLRTPEGYVPLHNDIHNIALNSGFKHHGCLMLKTAWLCTDHTGKDDGPIIVVPESFDLGRATLPHEWDPLRSPYFHRIVHLTGKAGSLAIWHGGAFHGMAPRTKTGLHVMLLQDWFRSYPMRTTFDRTCPSSPFPVLG